MTKWEGLAPTCLDDEFSTFVTREQGNIHTAALDVSRILVHDGVQLGMAHCQREEGLAWAVAHERFTTLFLSPPWKQHRTDSIKINRSETATTTRATCSVWVVTAREGEAAPTAGLGLLAPRAARKG